MYVPRSHIVQAIQKIAANQVADEQYAKLQLSFLKRKYAEDPSDPQVIKALQGLAEKGNTEAGDLLASPIPLRSV
jgi:hypothetical protein